MPWAALLDHRASRKVNPAAGSSTAAAVTSVASATPARSLTTDSGRGGGVSHGAQAQGKRSTLWTIQALRLRPLRIVEGLRSRQSIILAARPSGFVTTQSHEPCFPAPWDKPQPRYGLVTRRSNYRMKLTRLGHQFAPGTDNQTAARSLARVRLGLQLMRGR